MAFSAQNTYPITISGPLESCFPSRSEIYECYFKKSTTVYGQNIQVGQLFYFKSAFLRDGNIIYQMYCINTNQYVETAVNLDRGNTIKSDDINTLINGSKIAFDNFKLFFKIFS